MILFQAVAALAIFAMSVFVVWCQARSSHLQVAQQELDEYHRAAMALINDENVSVEIADFAAKVGEHLNNPTMARHVVRSIKNGDWNSAPRPPERADKFRGLEGKALENLSKVVVYGTLISASHDPFLARRWRSVILFALTKPAPAKIATKPAKSVNFLDAFAAKLAGYPLPVGVVDTGRAPSLASAMACS